MFVNRFHASQHGEQRRRLRVVLILLDVFGALAAGLVTIRFDLLTSSTSLNLWILAALLGWLLSRRDPQRITYRSYSQAALAPLYAVLIYLSLCILGEEDWSLRQISYLLFIWAGIMMASRFFLRRFLPSLTIGVIPGTDVGFLEHPRIEFLELKTPEDTSFSDIEGLVIDLMYPTASSWVDFYLHAHVGGIPVWDVSTLSEEINGQVTLEYLQNAHMNREHFLAPYAPLKRILDILAVAVFSIPILILMSIVAVVVLVDSGRPVLFWQLRVGQDGVPFRLAKFRTMTRDSERHGAAFAQVGDMRITRVGHFLRKFRLDELPQFWNVLRGEMSIIGPRPEQVAFVENFNRSLHLYSVRHWVKPGITGWAQVAHGYASGDDETLMKLRHDIYYIKHFSFWFDARIVARTLWTMATGFGAR